jgi:thermitase
LKFQKAEINTIVIKSQETVVFFIKSMFVVLCILNTLFWGNIVADDSVVPSQTDWVESEYIIKYNQKEVRELIRIPELSSYSEEQIKDALTFILGAEAKEHLSLIEAESITASDESDIDYEVAVDLLDSEIAEYISPNYIRTLNKVPNDPSYNQLWGLNQLTDIDINAPEAWEQISDDETKDIVVGVIDTGVDYNHPDLKANMWVNSAEFNGSTGVDNDGNGVVDDVHGYNAILNSGNPFDDHAHGTHCAGTIGAVGNNGIGITGVAWKVKIMALKFLAANGSGSDVNAIKTINYAVNMRNVGGNLKVLNNSWGGSGYNPALKQAIEAANDVGILFVVAAGNSNLNNDASPTYPAGYDVPNVISVAAISQNGNRASFSNYGANTVHLAAPGVGILSTIPGGGYASYNGTSMAAPHVSGVGVLAYGRMISYSPDELKAHLMEHVRPLPQLEGFMRAPGIVDARAAVASSANFPPVLENVPDQKISKRIRKKTIPLIAYDRENDPLTYEAEIKVAPYKVHAASVDQQYDFVQYRPELDNFFGIAEKRLVSNSGKEFFIFSNGQIYELNFPYYSYRISVDPIYFTNPEALVSAYPIDTTHLGKVELFNGSPQELFIELGAENNHGFDVSVSVSDGNRSDKKTFSVRVGESANCS